jgi:HlyD family secretion protein
LGSVAQIAPTGEIESGVVLFPVTIVLDPADVPVRADMTADVEIVTANAEDVLLLPAEAVQSTNGRTLVMRKLAEGESVERSVPAQAPEGVPEGERAQMRRQRTTGGGRRAMGAGGFAPVPVEVGARSADWVEIISGLEAGDEVVIINLEEAAQQMGGERPFGDPMLGGPPGAGRP